MARPSIVTSDPETAQIIAHLIAKGVPQSLIAKSYDIPHNTLSQWAKRKDFGRMLSSAKVSIGASQIDKIISSKHYKSAQIWLERSPDYREIWAAPNPGETAQGLLESLSGLAKAISGPKAPRQIEGQVVTVPTTPACEQRDEEDEG